MLRSLNPKIPTGSLVRAAQLPHTKDTKGRVRRIHVHHEHHDPPPSLG